MSRPDPVDDAEALIEPAIALVRSWVSESERRLSRSERRERVRFRELTNDDRSVAFMMSFADRVLRPESPEVAARQLREVVGGATPAFLSRIDRLLLSTGAAMSRLLPRQVMPLVRRRLRRIVGDLVADRDDPGLARHLRRLSEQGFRVNANLLGESVLGASEARRRLERTIALIERPDVDYVSIKGSSVTSQLNTWAHEESLQRVKESLRPLLVAAAGFSPPKFVNFDMEEYKDLRLTVDAFVQLLDEADLRALEAGIVLQAYLPDSFAALRHLVDWATRRHESGGAGIKIRLVKGANLAMERVDAVMHGWVQAPYETKADTDANYKRMLDWVMRPERVRAVRMGVASHNLFDVAWARVLAEHRQVSDRVSFEMLQGMAPGEARAVRAATGSLVLYTPVVASADFDQAVAYLFRRLEENSSGDNFLRHAFDLGRDPDAFAVESARFAASVRARNEVASEPRRRNGRAGPGAMSFTNLSFTNQADTDPLDDSARTSILAALRAPPRVDLPDEVLTPAGIDHVVAAALSGQRSWQAVAASERASIVRQVGDELHRRRDDLIAVMATEAAKTVLEADTEVSEAVDFARYYGQRTPELDPERGDGSRFEAFGVVAVIPPWNFPVAIPAGGILAALAAGNAVVVKPAPQTPRCALLVAEACRSAGVPPAAVQFVRCRDDAVGEHLVGHPDIGAIALTGAFETAQHFAHLAPDRPLFAETSGKNAVIVMPDADLDLAVTDLVRSAFGHAGQKCSAASLAILVGDVASSARFRRQLVDATSGLVVAPGTQPEATMGPLIEAPAPKLDRALTVLEGDQAWLLEPVEVDRTLHLWTPGIIAGVRPGDWFQRTECFGPVLGLIEADDLESAIAIQNSVAFGLTGGLHTLDPTNVDRWLAAVEVGNAYVNRPITGAVVGRQPFGGWKRSVVGPGAKAGGPNYVAQFGTWVDDGEVTVGQDLSPRQASTVSTLAHGLDTDDRHRLVAAARSDAHWWRREFDAQHDPTGLFCEANIFRYRPLPLTVIRAGPGSTPFEVARLVLAAVRAGAPIRISIDPAASRLNHLLQGIPSPQIQVVGEEVQAFAGWVDRERPARVRMIGGEALEPELAVVTYLDRRPVVSNGRIELARFLAEQSISQTLHRFGNLVEPVRSGRGHRPPAR